MNKKCTGVIFVLFLVTFLLSNRTFSQELKFITIDVAPWAYYDEEKKKFAGIFPDIVKEIEAKTGYTISIKLTPYVRVNRELEIGRQDCTMLVTEEDRSAITTLGELVFNMPLGVIPHKNISLKTYEDLYGIDISVLRGSGISKRFKQDDKLQKSFDTDYKIILRKVVHGRAEAVAGAIPTIQYLAKKQEMDNVLGEPLQLGVAPIYLQCSTKTQRNLEIVEVNKALKEMREDSTLDRITNKHW